MTFNKKYLDILSQVPQREYDNFKDLEKDLKKVYRRNVKKFPAAYYVKKFIRWGIKIGAIVQEGDQIKIVVGDNK